MNNNNMIRIYGSANPNVPRAKPSIADLFTVVADMYMVVPMEYLEDVIRFVKSLGYVYKTKTLTKNVVFALQYQKP